MGQFQDNDDTTKCWLRGRKGSSQLSGCKVAQPLQTAPWSPLYYLQLHYVVYTEAGKPVFTRNSTHVLIASLLLRAQTWKQ